MGQIYRRFSSKSDIILSIVEENARARVAEMHGIFDTIERNERSMFDALKAITDLAAEWRRRPLLRDSRRGLSQRFGCRAHRNPVRLLPRGRSDEHTSELQSLMRISYAVFCLKTK